MKLFVNYRKKDHPPLRVGKFGVINYGLGPEALAPSSLNPENVAVARGESSRDLLKNLRFVNAKDKDPGAPRLTLTLGLNVANLVVVFIGTLDELLHKGEFALKAKVHGLDWSTTSLSEQKLEIGKAGVKIKDSDMKEVAKTDEPRIKGENKEMKEFGTREPDLMIKGEDTKKGDGGWTLRALHVEWQHGNTYQKEVPQFGNHKVNLLIHLGH
ncbi:uncharacterized protein K444DRAFT_628005 [Hyaloscypha bicolor E]|uniref:Uncharacterized protein n=1 Tax=Hyaloscypha bicolor E TaxID=1095630 RepID=A0A2J6TG22_9HELO|nr:uncharacterized protein K444DRAFT_628005 [Hyaloscypha bicolor E]PMD61971.1 hypothetical protein K444DRAFT_628005 [Hyaloscypha bicolor E]